MSSPFVVYEDDYVKLWQGDAREWLTGIFPAVDAIVTDPPYGDTALGWDRIVDGWQNTHIAPQAWVFGSLRSTLATGQAMTAAGWKYGQDVVWEKHNGSGFTADRFKRVHELAVQWYRGEWSALHADVPKFAGERKRGTRRAQPPHRGQINESPYDSSERLERSVLYVRSEHGRAVHPTQKPLGILRPLIQYSVPPGGLVLDPFAGSGSTLLAAREMGRRAEGCEIDPAYCQAAVQRLNALTLEVA